MANVTVIIPAYNAALFIGETLQSVLAQTYKEYDIIVVDDGSTDETAKVVQSFGGRVRTIHQSNGGPSRARNRAIENTATPYLAFLDSDDLWRPGKLERQMAFMEKHPEVGLSFTDADEIQEGRVVTASLHATKPPFSSVVLREGRPAPIDKEAAYRALLKSSFILPSTVVVRREVMKIIGGFNETMGHCEDRDLWLRIAERYTIGCLSDILATHRLHGQNLSMQTKRNIAERINLFERLLAAERDEERRRILKEQLAGFTFKMGRLEFHERRYGESLRQFRRSREVGLHHWKLYPFLLISRILRGRSG